MIPKWFADKYEKAYGSALYEYLEIAWWGYRIGVQRERMRATCGARLTKNEYEGLGKEGK